MPSETTDIVERLKTRFDPRIVQPDELSREAAEEIERLRARVEFMIAGIRRRNESAAPIVAVAALAMAIVFMGATVVVKVFGL
jgi:hypothetical protein